MDKISLASVGPENLTECGIGCLANPKCTGSRHKVEWLGRCLKQGLRFLLFRDRQGRPHRVSWIAALAVTACAPSASHDVPRILLFEGTGTSPNDVAAVKAILEARHLEFSSASASQLNGMSESQLQTYRLMIVPGGNYITIGNSLTPTTANNIRNAVQGGLNYLGICAGGLLAGNAPDVGLNLTGGVRFDFYAAVKEGVHKAAVRITGVGMPAIEHYWEDGPQYTGWGAVVGKYPDGTPAIVEGRFGKGWVLLVGTHPEAPESWRRGMTFTTPAGVGNAYAGTLVEAALVGKLLPHF